MNVVCIAGVCVELTLELGGVLLGVVGVIATVLNNRQQKANRQQRERHFQAAQAAATASPSLIFSSSARSPRAGSGGRA
jgi:hypothetical protein